MRKNAKKGLDRVNASLPELLGLSRAGKRETLLPSALRDAAIVGCVASARLSQETREERRRLSGRGGAGEHPARQCPRERGPRGPCPRGSGLGASPSQGGGESEPSQDAGPLEGLSPH